VTSTVLTAGAPAELEEDDEESLMEAAEMPAVGSRGRRLTKRRCIMNNLYQGNFDGRTFAKSFRWRNFTEFITYEMDLGTA
jgi:hypothetical protein